jgi:hypothetical protein
VVPGGEVGFELWLRWHEGQHLRAVRAAEGGPGHGLGRGVAVAANATLCSRWTVKVAGSS